MTDAPEKPAPNWQLRLFGVALGAGVVILCSLAFSLTKREDIPHWLQPLPYWAGLAVALLGVLLPAVMRPPFVLITKVNRAIGRAFTATVLTAFYFIIITPMALLFRAIGRDALRRRRFPGAESTFWTDKTGAPDTLEDCLPSPSLMIEIYMFMAENKKWWLLPIVIMLVLLGLLLMAGGLLGSAAPFIYPMF